MTFTRRGFIAAGLRLALAAQLTLLELSPTLSRVSGALTGPLIGLVTLTFERVVTRDRSFSASITLEAARAAEIGFTIGDSYTLDQHDDEGQRQYQGMVLVGMMGHDGE